MPRRILAITLLGLGAVGPLWTGCATQADMSKGRVNASSVGAESGQESGGSNSGSGGNAGSHSASGGTLGMSSGGSGGAAGSAGAAVAMGGDSGDPGAGGAEPQAGGAGGAGPECTIAAECDDDNPCTTDACLLEHCSHTASTAPCEDDQDPCTEDVCSQGACTHPDSGACECKVAADCNDNQVCTTDTCVNNECVRTNNALPCMDDGSACTNDVCTGGQCTHPSNNSCECLSAADCNDDDPCTFNQCNAAGDCVYPDNGTCMVGTPFVVNNFNSVTDWTNNVTTPGARPLVQTGFFNTNLEQAMWIYLAADTPASLEMNLASMVGLTKLRIVIRCGQPDTGPMVHVGTWNGTAWSEKVLGSYAAIPIANFATIEVPLLDFGQNLAHITKMRLRFAPAGDLKEWRIDEISAAL
jgi:hypothetical protein